MVVDGKGLDCCPWMWWHSEHPEFLGPAGPISSTATPLSPDGHAHAESRKKKQVVSIICTDYYCYYYYYLYDYEK